PTASPPRSLSTHGTAPSLSEKQAVWALAVPRHTTKIYFVVQRPRKTRRSSRECTLVAGSAWDKSFHLRKVAKSEIGAVEQKNLQPEGRILPPRGAPVGSEKPPSQALPRTVSRGGREHQKKSKKHRHFSCQVTVGRDGIVPSE